MKRFSLITLFTVSFLLLSFRCTTSRWWFLIELNVQNEDGEKIDKLDKLLDIKFVPKLEGSNTSIKNFYPTYNYPDGNKTIDTYDIELYNCPMDDVPFQKTYLEWDKLDDILDNYVIKISDPNEMYNGQTTPTLREMIQESKYKDWKLSGYDENGHVLPDGLVFNITLTKNQETGEASLE